MGAIITALWVALRGSLAIFVGWRGIILVTLLSYLGITLYNLYCAMVQEIINFMIAQVGAVSRPGGIGGILSAAGLAGYLVSKLRLIECLNFVISIVTLKWVIVKIPFLKW